MGLYSSPNGCADFFIQAVASGDVAILSDAASGEVIRSFDQSSDVLEVDFSPNGKILVSVLY